MLKKNYYKALYPSQLNVFILGNCIFFKPLYLYRATVQSNPTIAALKGLIIFSVIGGLLLLPVDEIKENPFIGQ